jgi:outer membrane biosynthesis protein TonB
MSQLLSGIISAFTPGSQKRKREAEAEAESQNGNEAVSQSTSKASQPNDPTPSKALNFDEHAEPAAKANETRARESTGSTKRSPSTSSSKPDVEPPAKKQKTSPQASKSVEPPKKVAKPRASSAKPPKPAPRGSSAKPPKPAPKAANRSKSPAKQPRVSSEARCPISKADFMNKAEFLDCKICDNTVALHPKDFSATGSFGYHGNARIPVKVGRHKLLAQLSLNLTIIGSKDSK